MEGDDLQQIVMERDGKFEVLSAVDLQVEQVKVPEQLQTKEGVEVAGTSENQDEQNENQDCIQHINLQDNEHRVAGDMIDVKPNPNEHFHTQTDQQAGDTEPSKEKEHALDEGINLTTNSDQPHLLEKPSDPAVSDVPTTSAEGGLESSEPATLSQPPLSSPVDTKNSSASQVPLNEQPMAQHKEKQLQVRTKSAPASRSVLKREEEERERRKQLSDAAFSAWLSRKKTEVIAKRKEERAGLSYTAEDMQRKKEQCDLVYQNWLEAKNKQWKSERIRERAFRPSTGVPKGDEERCLQAFENWMKKKQTQYVEEKKTEQMKSQELEDAAKRADPSVVEKAYREWLVRKREQAKEEASKKEQYRKLYFSQPGQLKKHTREKFGGY